jgi:hypothetical protein
MKDIAIKITMLSSVLFIGFIGYLEFHKPNKEIIQPILNGSDTTKFISPKASYVEDDKELEAQKNEARIGIRDAYEEKLRNIFLDSGLDIKVKISGKNSDKMVLTYILFNDVWHRRFDTDGSVSIWGEMGFKSVMLSNNYDYMKGWKWKN